jgi:uncharacterized RmlC-like cupin family protein
LEQLNMPFDKTEPDKQCLRVVQKGRTINGKQGHVYTQGVSAESVESKAIHLQLLTLPPGEMARGHKHEAHETAIYIMSGISGVWWGDRLQNHSIAKAGEFVYIPGDVPHLPYNVSFAESCTCVIARTDPNDQESVILLPEIEAEWMAREEVQTWLLKRRSGVAV